MTTLPHVELGFAPSILDPQTRAKLARRDRDVAEVLRDTLISNRTAAVRYARENLKSNQTINATVLGQIMDLAWKHYFWFLGKNTLPYLVEIYARQFKKAGVEVPVEYMDKLALDFVTRLGTYFHETSKDALVQGFQMYVNQKMPPRAALDKVLPGYGMTPRQMRGLVTSTASRASKVNSISSTVDFKTENYIRSSVLKRVDNLVFQEAHNLEQQAQQTVWLYLHSQKKISPDAEKVWLTAKDERVCPVCGPLHGVKIPVLERFAVGAGALWVPGAHPNCRCEVKLINALSLVKKAYISKAGEKWYQDEQVRNSKGQFATAREKLQDMQAKRPRTQFAEPEPGLRLNQPVIEVEEEPVIEVEEEKPTFQPKASLTSKPTFQPKQQYQARQELQTKQEPTLPTQAKSDLKQEMSTFLQDKGDLESKRERFHASVMDAMRGLSLLPSQQKPRTSTKSVVYSPTIKLERPIYAVLPASVIDQHGQVHLDHEDVTWTVDESAAAMEAVEFFDASITEYADYLEHNQGNVVYKKHPVSGEQMQGSIDRSDVYEVLWAVGYGQESNKTAEHSTVDVEWHSEDGNYIYTEQTPAWKIASEWDILPGELDVIVVKINEGHNSSLGETHMVESGTRYGAETWTASGRYNVHQSHENWGLREGFPVIAYELIPDVETTVITEDETE